MQSKDATPGWLKNLQENSWEAEILISGGAVFALLAGTDFLIEFTAYLKFSAAFAGLDQTALIFMVALKGITVGFILHLVLRGVWVSLVCLNYSFPKGINFERLKLSEVYDKEARQYELTSKIVKLDDLSGLVFFGSFAFVIIAMGYFILLVFAAVVTILFENIFEMNGDWIFWSVIGISILFFIDLIFAGLLRRNNAIGKLFYPVYWLFNKLSLASVYRPWLQLLFSNINKGKAFIFLVLFMVVTFAYANVSLVKLFHWRTFINSWDFDPAPGYRLGGFYENHLEAGNTIYAASIPSEIIQGKLLRVFVPYRNTYDESIRASGGKYFSDIIKVSVNDSIYQQAEWFPVNHEITHQRGIFTVLFLTDLPAGKNIIEVHFGNDFYKSRGIEHVVIPFWKE